MKTVRWIIGDVVIPVVEEPKFPLVSAEELMEAIAILRAGAEELTKAITLLREEVN